jgi:hypothetical protein
MVARIDRDELRLLIREALKEALGGESPPPRKDTEEKNAQQQRPSPSPTPPRKREGQALHFNSGVLNEVKVAEIGRTHAKIIIGTEVAVTPLARDRAREIKVEIVRQKP